MIRWILVCLMTKKDKIYGEIPKSANGYRMKSDYLNTQS